MNPTTHNTPNDALDAYVDGQMQHLNIPGASLAVVEGDTITYHRGYGLARPGGETSGPQTPFFIGSLTKSFTALAVMQLVERGLVELDAPVQRYLPWFRVADPEASAAMTVHHLLNQTSGLPTMAGELILAEDDSPDALERGVRGLATLKVTRPPGSTFQYCNLNYNILGLIVEVTTGESYADYVKHYILEPLGMSHTYTSKAVAQGDGLALGHRQWFSNPVPAPDLPIPGGSLPSGQLISCAEDMAHYLIAHLNGGRYGDARILSGAGIDEMHRGAVDWLVGDTSMGRYGMGWVECDMDHTKTFSHAGNVPDFVAFMAIVPEQQRGLVLLFNSGTYGLPPLTEEVGTGATAVLAGVQPPPPKLGFVPTVFRLLPLLPLLQVVTAIATVGTLRRWSRDGAHRPAGARPWARHVLLPLIPNLSLAGGLAYLKSSGMLAFLRLFMPDLAWILGMSGVFAAIWAVLRTGLILRTLTKTPAPGAEKGDACQCRCRR